MRRTVPFLVLALSGLTSLPAVLVPAILVPCAAHAEEEAAKPKENFISLGDFTINLPQAGRRAGYLIVSVTVQADPDAASGIKDVMPRVKEAVMRQLMTMSDHHLLRANETDPLTVKDALLDTVTKLQPHGVEEILITRMLYS